MREPVCVTLRLDQRKLPAEIFMKLTAKLEMASARERRRQQALENFGKPGRDPSLVGGVLGNIIDGQIWHESLANARLNDQWDSIVGAEIAKHTEEVQYSEGVVTVYASSTVWQTHMAYLREQMEGKVRAALEGLPFHKLTVTGPRKFATRRGYIRNKRAHTLED